MRRTVPALLIGLICCLISFEAAGQSYQERREQLIERQQNTRAEIDQINKQISTYQERLQLAEEKYERLYNQYQDLQKVIALHDEKIEKLDKELNHIEEEIAITEEELTRNRNHLDRLVKNYKETLSYLYKHGRTSQLALILTAGSINQMLVRAYYLERFQEHREKQVRQIRETEEELEHNRSQLEQARLKNAGVLAEIRAEKKKLSEKQARQKKNVALLQRNKQQIQDRLQEDRRQKKLLENTLENLIAEEERIRKENQRLEAERKRKLAAARSIQNDAERAKAVAKYSEPIKNDNYIDNSTLATIESSFSSQKGALRWPVQSSTISEHFGRRRHPVYGTETENLGIEIVTKPEETVRVIHEGFVSKIMPIPGYGDVVIVSHGNFRTFYGNLSQVMVRKNEVLKTGDVIGLSGNRNSVKGESVFFMVSKGNQIMDPEQWLANK